MQHNLDADKFMIILLPCVFSLSCCKENREYLIHIVLHLMKLQYCTVLLCLLYDPVIFSVLLRWQTWKLSERTKFQEDCWFHGFLKVILFSHNSDSRLVEFLEHTVQ